MDMPGMCLTSSMSAHSICSPCALSAIPSTSASFADSGKIMLASMRKYYGIVLQNYITG